MKKQIRRNYPKLLLGFAMVMCGLTDTNSFAVLPILDSAFNPGNGHTSYLLDTSNWSDAENRAVSLGGHLATIRSLTENSFVCNRWGTNRELWIGLFDPNWMTDGTGAQHAADFIWSSGEPAAFRNWRGGEPNNGNSGEGYAYIYAKQY